MKKEEVLLELNHSCYEMISHCETKISILTAIDIGIIAAIIGVYGSNDFYCASSEEVSFIILTIYFGLIVLGAILSIITCLIASISRFLKPSDERKNLFYYCDISELDLTSYKDLLDKDQNVIEDLMLENIVLSNVLKKKYMRFNLALRFLLYPILLVFIPFISRAIKRSMLRRRLQEKE